MGPNTATRGHRAISRRIHDRDARIDQTGYVTDHTGESLTRDISRSIVTTELAVGLIVGENRGNPPQGPS